MTSEKDVGDKTPVSFLFTKEAAAMLASGESGISLIRAAPLVRRAYPHLEKLCHAIREKDHSINEAIYGIKNLFYDTDSLETRFSQGQSCADLFVAMRKNIEDAIGSALATYQRTQYIFHTNLKDNIELTERRLSPEKTAAFADAYQLLENLIVLHAEVKEKTPKLLDFNYKAISIYNQYLKDRFIKSDENQQQPDQRALLKMMIEGEVPRVTKYLKIKLIDGNPVLTDLLLNLSDNLPSYKILNGKNNKKTRKIISSYAVNDAVDNLMALSDAKLLLYMNAPQMFFTSISYVLDTFYNLMEAIEPHYQELIKSVPDLIGFDTDGLRKKTSYDIKNIARRINRIKSADFDNIVQRPDDAEPDNRREKDFFALREKLLTELHLAMHDINNIETENKRTEIAKKAIESGIKLKTEIDELLTTATARKLRSDKKTDNEFYVGKKRHPGEFYFERAPTPDAKLDDVIGASFDEVKRHLMEIIETASYSRLMRISAPGGRVRSNILMIGPYGCGKTEISKAACADSRVIGCNVSIADTLTAYMHESVSNAKRVYDGARELFIAAREQKPTLVSLDEFDGWFAKNLHGYGSDKDMQQIQNVLQEVLDGMEGYHGIITVAMTNEPFAIPKAILRRFRYVDIVGELNEQERIDILKMYLERSLPVHDDVKNNYAKWAGRFDSAPGDVIRKVVDELHLKTVSHYIKEHPKEAARIEKVLYRRERNEPLSDKDRTYVRDQVAKYKIITPDSIDNAVDDLLMRPVIKVQVDAARKLYRDARRLMDDLASGKNNPGFGLKDKDRIFGMND